MHLWLDSCEVKKKILSLSDFQFIWSNLEKELYQNRKLVHYVVIDGQPFYSDYETIIADNFERIQEIKAYSITFQHAIRQSYTDMVDYINKVIASLTDLTDPFYAEPTPESWGLFQQFCEGINWLVHTARLCTMLSETESEYLDVSLKLSGIVIRIPELLRTIEHALQEQEYILMADTIKYEIGPLLEEIVSLLEECGVAHA